jgi:hypothetical protein
LKFIFDRLDVSENIFLSGSPFNAESMMESSRSPKVWTVKIFNGLRGVRGKSGGE